MTLTKCPNLWQLYFFCKNILDEALSQFLENIRIKCFFKTGPFIRYTCPIKWGAMQAIKMTIKTQNVIEYSCRPLQTMNATTITWSTFLFELLNWIPSHCAECYGPRWSYGAFSWPPATTHTGSKAPDSKVRIIESDWPSLGSSKKITTATVRRQLACWTEVDISDPFSTPRAKFHPLAAGWGAAWWIGS